MPTIDSNGFVEEKFINDHMRARTFRLAVIDDGFVTRQDIVKALSQYHIDEMNIEFIYQLDKGREWFVVLKLEEDIERFLRISHLLIKEGVSVSLQNITRQNVRIHAHWLPPFISNEFVEQYFSQFGEVYSAEFTYDSSNYINQASRVIRIVMDDHQRAELPHIVHLNNGRFKMLITCPGRSPMCTRCYEIGHTRRECRQNTGNRRSYASAARGPGPTNPPPRTETRDETDNVPKTKNTEATKEPNTTEAETTNEPKETESTNVPKTDESGINIAESEIPPNTVVQDISLDDSDLDEMVIDMLADKCSGREKPEESPTPKNPHKKQKVRDLGKSKFPYADGILPALTGDLSCLTGSPSPSTEGEDDITDIVNPG